MKYSQIVDYSKLDPVKAAALEKFSGTMKNPESAAIKEEKARNTLNALALTMLQ